MMEHEGDVDVFNGKLKESANQLLKTKDESNHVKSECLDLEKECQYKIL